MSHHWSKPKLRRRLTAVAVSALMLPALLSPTATAQVAPRGSCGFYFTNPDHEPSVNARYYHCGDTFILIRVDWSDGWHHRECVPPWNSIAFRPAGHHRVVNAYYVPGAPSLMGQGADRMCRTAQPQE